MAQTYCNVSGCRFADFHVTSAHQCGKCEFFGHGQRECNNEVRKELLTTYFNELIPEENKCTIPNCLFPRTHITAGHLCLYCGKRRSHMKQCPIIDNTSIFTDPRELQDDYVIQQYTGLTDKNGKEVYEGDIVKIKRWYLRPFINNKQEIDYQHIEGETEVGQVMWGWNSQKYLVSYEHIRYDDSEDFDKSSHRVEVIGNIFDNPELLK